MNVFFFLSAEQIEGCSESWRSLDVAPRVVNPNDS